MLLSSKKKAKRVKFPAAQRNSKSKKKKRTKKKTVPKSRKVAAKDRGYEVGYKKPPKEHQFPPGQSGNPQGAPVHRINLWPLFCGFMNLTDAELEKLDPKKVTQAQQAAIRLIKDMKEGKYSGSQRLARHVFDREEGKPVEHVVIEQGDILTDAECEEIRQAILKNNAI